MDRAAILQQVKEKGAEAIADLAQVLHEEDTKIRQDVSELEKRMEGRLAEVAQQQQRSPSGNDDGRFAQGHSAGFCKDNECEPCMGQRQEVAVAGYNKGMEELMEQINFALVAAGGEPLKQRVHQVLQEGEQLRQPIPITG